MYCKSDQFPQLDLDAALIGVFLEMEHTQNSFDPIL